MTEVELDPQYRPISPPVEQGARGTDLPAYLSNGLIGLRVREDPLRQGMCLVSGFSGEHHERRIEAAAACPYPLAADIELDGVRTSDQPERIRLIDQAHDFATGELTSRIEFEVGEARLEITVLTFCSRTHPTIVCQETQVRADRSCEITWRGRIDPAGNRGRVLRRRTETPGEPEPACDGVMLWGSEGDLSSVGLALLTEGPEGAERTCDTWDEQGPLETAYKLSLPAGETAAFRQLVSLLPSVMHGQPDAQALRLLTPAKNLGFEELRRRNRQAWADLWRGRIRLIGADAKWQALADAAYYYLNTSVHAASPASTSIFGLATWHNYHYYFGHVMWDVDAFAVPVVSLFQPLAAESLLGFRYRYLTAARDNAKMQGLPGVKFPWEAAPSTGEEATPGAAAGATREDHISLHVARAFAFYADVTGDERFLKEQAWPVLAGVAEWIAGRVTPREDGGFDWLEVGGAAEREAASNNDALTNMLARSVLERAVALAERVGQPAPARWAAVASGLEPPRRSDGAIAAHDGHRITEEQGAAPTPLMAFFPYWCEVDPDTERRTLELYLDHWAEYVGAPMLAAFYPVWALWLGERRLALKLMDEGYGAYQTGRFAQTLEYRLDKVPGGVAAGPFFANIGGFLMMLVLGLAGLRPGAGPPQSWPHRQVLLPPGWTAVECDRLWIQGRPARLRARDGEAKAELVWC